MSRKFLYEQRHKADAALDEVFSDAKKEQKVLFYLPVTQAWLFQLILALILICHCSYRGIVELLRDLFDLPISVGTIHNRLQVAAEQAAAINQSQDLSAIRVGLHDEIYQGEQPVLVGVDARSTYCYLLAAAESRDENTWGFYLLEVMEQGLNPEYTIADAACMTEGRTESCFGRYPLSWRSISHPATVPEFEQYSLSPSGERATSRRQKLEQQMQRAKQQSCGNRLSTRLSLARRAEQQAVQLAKDVKTLTQWLSHDVLALAGPPLSDRQELFDFIVAELRRREISGYFRLRPLCVALEKQRHDLLAFAQVLDEKLVEIAQQFDTPLFLVRAVCLLQRKKPSSNAYWTRWNQLHHLLPRKFHLLMKAVTEAMKQTPRASSLVENLNSRLRNYFFLRRQPGPQYLDLLRFFLNHRTFTRSECPERVGKSPTQLMTGQPHAHWLELLGFERFQRA